MPNRWAKVVPPLRGAARNGTPKKVGRPMPMMPLGPPVNWYQLMMTMRMISPKPSVTMAR